MISKSMDNGWMQIMPLGDNRIAVPTWNGQSCSPSKPSVDAFDQIFDGLAEKPAPGLGTIPAMSAIDDNTALDPQQIRNIAVQIDRQHERLKQLLREIENAGN